MPSMSKKGARGGFKEIEAVSIESRYLCLQTRGLAIRRRKLFSGHAVKQRDLSPVIGLQTTRRDETPIVGELGSIIRKKLKVVKKRDGGNVSYAN